MNFKKFRKLRRVREMLRNLILVLCAFFVVNGLSTQATAQEIWIAKTPNKVWETPLEYLMFNKNVVINGYFLSERFVLGSCEDSFDEGKFICDSLTEIRKGTFSEEENTGSFKLKNTGKYLENVDFFWDKLEPNMHIQRGSSEYSIDGRQMAVFNENRSRPIYFEKFDLKDLVSAYKYASILEHAEIDNHKCLQKMVRDKTWPKLHSVYMKVGNINAILELVSFLGGGIEESLSPSTWENKVNLFQKNYMKYSIDFRRWKEKLALMGDAELENYTKALITIKFGMAGETPFPPDHEIWTKTVIKIKSEIERMLNLNSKFYEAVTSPQYIKFMKSEGKSEISCLKGVTD